MPWSDSDVFCKQLTSWKEWRRECLLDLREMSSKYLKIRMVDAEKGVMVHMYEQNQKRNKWHLGVMEPVIKTRRDSLSTSENLTEDQEAIKHI